MKTIPGGSLARVTARLPTYLADAWAHPGWALMFCFGRFLAARNLRDTLLGDTARGSTPGLVSPGRVLSAEAPATVARALLADGLHRGLRLDADTVGAIHAFAVSRPCYAGLDRRLSFLAADHAVAERLAGRPILVGHFLDAVTESRAATAVAEDPFLHAVASAYLGPAAKVIAHRLWWSFPAPAASLADAREASQHGFHFDLDDWKQLKFFFYLTDVDEDAGPHRYVRGSHARRPLSHQLSPFVGRTDDAILSAYGAGSVVTITGPAGTGFAEDPFGYHTGTPPRSGRRLILEVSFGVSGVLRRRRFGEAVASKSDRREPASP